MHISEKSFKALIFLIFAIAFYLRLDAYLINNSFFTDEILLAQNIIERNGIELFYPLNYFQSAPFLFLILSKAVSLININELAFRFIPFISSILSVYLFYILIKDLFKTKLAKCLGLFTFAISYQLLFYAQAFKQYSSDVLVSIIVLLIANRISNAKLSSLNWILMGVVWTILLAFSFPAYIMLMAVCIALVCTKKECKYFYSMLFPFVFSIFYYILNLSKLGNSLYLNDYWKKGYEIFSLGIYKINFDFLFHYYSFPLLLLALVIFGLYYLYKNNKFYFFNTISIFLITIFAAFLHIYPFERRLVLFLLPVLILLAIYPLDNIKRSWSSAVVLLFSFVFFLSGYITFGRDFVSGKVSYLRQDVKPLLGIIASKSKDENIYLYYGSYASYSYYSRLYSLPAVIWGTYPRDENLSEKYLISDLENLPAGTYYLLFIKGTWTYEKDIKTFDFWAVNNAVILNKISLKSASLYKIKIM